MESSRNNTLYPETTGSAGSVTEKSLSSKLQDPIRISRQDRILQASVSILRGAVRRLITDRYRRKFYLQFR